MSPSVDSLKIPYFRRFISQWTPLHCEVMCRAGCIVEGYIWSTVGKSQKCQPAGPRSEPHAEGSVNGKEKPLFCPEIQEICSRILLVRAAADHNLYKSDKWTGAGMASPSIVVLFVRKI